MNAYTNRARQPRDVRVVSEEPASGAGTFSEGAARPLGKGYSEIMQMVLSYAVEGKKAGNPTLAHSLDRFRQIAGMTGHFAGLAKDNLLCLIEGYSTPGNAEALIHFIGEVHPSVPRIETVDLYDLPHLYEVLDIKMPCMRYHIADASHLDQLYRDGSVDVVVQDFLLNCIPATRHEALLREVGRIMKPGGVGLISFTSCEALDVASALSTARLEADEQVTWDSKAYDLAETQKANASGSSLSRLMGKLIYNEASSEFIYVAKAGGRFEFFRSKEDMFSLFEEFGLHLQGVDVTTGSDDHGLSCVRYRCLLVRKS